MPKYIHKSKMENSKRTVLDINPPQLHFQSIRVTKREIPHSTRKYPHSVTLNPLSIHFIARSEGTHRQMVRERERNKKMQGREREDDVQHLSSFVF